MLLINKSDFLTPELIAHWNAYFKEKNIKHLFFSALIEQNKIDFEDEPEDIKSEHNASDSEEETKIEQTLELIKVEDALQSTVKESVFSREFIEQDEIEKQAMLAKQLENEQIEKNQQRIRNNELTFNSEHIFNRAELLALLKHYAKTLNGRDKSRESNERLMVGTVGYPNVGKSSVINVLCGKKLVGVANRPGKTKHF
jgi:large subunit GTPase 1